MKELNAILTIAYRDFTKFLRDKPRIVASFIFPVLLIGVLGVGLDANLADDVGFSFLAFVFTGVLAQTLFQSSAAGVISLVEDRENDFSKEMFVSPVSRYSIVIGKIFGEASVSMVQGLGVIVFGILLGVPLSLPQFTILIPASLIATFLGGAFGILVLANLGTQRRANQIFPFIIFPQFFLAGVFNPIKDLPWYLFILSRIAPMTYAVDFLRGLYYSGKEEFSRVVLLHPATNLLIILGLFMVFLLIGTYLFVRNEKNR